MIREVGETIGRAVLDGIGRASSRVQEQKTLPADLLEDDEAYLAVFDAPGATASDVSVRLESRTVLVDIDRFREYHDGFEMRFPGRGLTLSGEVDLPPKANVDPKGADATVTQNGTLEVWIPKTTTEKSTTEADSETTDEPSDGAGTSTPEVDASTVTDE